jgi:mannose-6-phosphate isomerase-like protein (cupin superfamily)
MRVIEKPWGKEEVLEINGQYMVKRLTMFKGCRCSLQYHNQKRETIVVLSGVMNFYHGKSADDLMKTVCLPGDSFTIAPGELHRMEGAEEIVYLEASTPDIDDVVRVQDDFNRATSG